MNTPETDKRVWSDHSEGILYEVVEASFARKLERERDEAREERDKLKHFLAADSENVDAYLGVCVERDEAREKAERYRLEANAMMMQRDEAREEINRYREKLDLLPISWDV
jgi:DNA relaxase NicK